MSSISTSKSSCKHSCDKCLSPAATNTPLNENDLPIRTNDININGHPYSNTPSPSSIASSNSYKSRSKSDYYSQLSSKRRQRHDKLFHYTHSLNRQYVITMTNVLFQMQKEIYKLKRRTHHMEQMLNNQAQSVLPIIRIPRLTKDEISTICVKNSETQQNIPSIHSEEHETNNEPFPMTTNDLKPSNDTESSITLKTKSPIHTPQEEQTSRTKYCATCNREFSHRSAYLRHKRRIHDGIFPPTSDNTNLFEIDSCPIQTPVSTTDQPENDNDDENDSFQVLINGWDYGEGRLRPRRVSKINTESKNKIKCNMCNKFYRAEYIKKHQSRTHRASKLSVSSELTDTLDQPESIPDEAVDDIQTVADESSKTDTNPPSAITVAEMDVDDMPIQFRKEPNKPIVIAATCLDRYQIAIVDEFLKKFSSRVCQTPVVDFQTTHLITNDDQHSLRSPLSMKLIAGIAQHCFCLSYRWIVDCLKYDRIVDENPYEIDSDESDCQSHGGPKRSRLTDERHSLFKKICFMIKCSENHDSKVTNDRLQDLIITCGGQIITCVTQSLLDENDIAVLCDKQYVLERRHNYDQCRALGIHFVSPNWVIESIREYRRKPFLSVEETP